MTAAADHPAHPSLDRDRLARITTARPERRAALRERPARGARFWDRLAERYAKKPVPDAAAYAEKLARTRARLTPEMRVLELGCGTGSTAIALASAVESIRAVDLSPKMVAIAEDKAAAEGVANVTFDAATAEDALATAGSVDAVLAMSLIHLLPDRDAALTRIANVLPRGGLFVSSTACVSEIMPILRWVAPIGTALGILPTLRVFSRSELRASVEAAGFEILEDWTPPKSGTLFLIARKR